jgi:membrane protein involved in colicin uptake
VNRLNSSKFYFEFNLMINVQAASDKVAAEKAAAAKKAEETAAASKKSEAEKAVADKV